MTEPIRLMLVDNDTLLRRCLATVLNRRRGLCVVGEAGDGTSAISQARSLQPDLVVVDITVPEGGSTLVEEIYRATPQCRVLVLTSGQDANASSALLAGARGYLKKCGDPDELVQAIKLVHAGGLVVAPEVVQTVLKHVGDEDGSAPSRDGLTSRELEVLQLVAQGRTNAEIARALFIAEHTVKGHLARILAKLNLENRVQLAIYAAERGLATSGSNEPSQPDHSEAS